MATIAKPSSAKRRAAIEPAVLVAVGEREEHGALARQRVARRRLALRERHAEVRSIPITSPVERISGPSTVSTSGKRLNGSTASFTDT